jgi:hypothetical protein
MARKALFAAWIFASGRVPEASHNYSFSERGKQLKAVQNVRATSLQSGREGSPSVPTTAWAEEEDRDSRRLVDGRAPKTAWWWKPIKKSSGGHRQSYRRCLPTRARGGSASRPYHSRGLAACLCG